MMMIRSLRLFLLILLGWVLFFPDLRGQEKDFQTWWEGELQVNLPKGFDLSGELEQRFRNNSLQYDRSLFTLTGGYEVSPYIDVAAGLRTVAVQDRELKMHSKFRIHADATGNYPVAGLDLSLRVRVQYGFDDVLDIGSIRINNLVNRNRLKVDYHIFGTRFLLAASVESWHLLNDVPSRLTYKMRYSGEVGYALSFVSSVSLRYILEDEFNVKNPLQSYILLVGYKHQL
ncbi:MAG: DUF2490 domain-containing protein [Bacteroidales bacterium]